MSAPTPDPPTRAGVPSYLNAAPPDGHDDSVPHIWCSECGMLEPPSMGPGKSVYPCPNCGSPWRWQGRVADRDGTADSPPDDRRRLAAGFGWARYPRHLAHFGWGWRPKEEDDA